jgi:hypothetical protein
MPHVEAAPVRVRYKDWDCDIEFRRYAKGGAIHMQLWDVEDGEPVVTATLNPEFPPPYYFGDGRSNPEWAKAYAACMASPGKIPEGYVVIKGWGMECEGMLKTLVSAGIVADTSIRIRCGYAQAFLARLLVEPHIA